MLANIWAKFLRILDERHLILAQSGYPGESGPKSKNGFPLTFNIHL